MSEKMNNQILRAKIQELNEATNSEFIVNSFDMGDNDRTTYGLVKKNKDGTMDLVLDAKYSKRDIYYHVDGYLLLSARTVSTKIVEDTKPPAKQSSKKTTKKED